MARIGTICRTALLPLSLLLIDGIGLPGTAAEMPARGAERVDFVRDIRPIFVERCLACHGPDEQNGDVRLDNRDTLRERQAAGDPLVVPGQVEQSPLLTRVLHDDPDLRMPPEGEPLSQEQLALLRDWIEQGGDWPEEADHWAFLPPHRPPLPEVVDRQWPRNAIDYFVLERLEGEGLTPAAEADPVTLIRRLSLDLTGLPPEPEQVDRFLADRAPDAYERLVDRLLDSPHYGERWATRWLDLGRYGDTDGYDYDRPRPSWPYRDWVIWAFNRDMPFDRFTIEQLAGDLLPDATVEQQTATGFIRNSAVPQYRFDMLVDRVSTLGTVFLGLSLECAQCHNHKFDPVSQREFYQLYALFNNAEDQLLDVHSLLTGAPSKTLVVAERERPQTTHLAIGGSFLNQGERVEPGGLESLHGLPEAGVSDRLALAEWLVQRDNPLTARVTVNRQWEAFFGQGLVPTSEDLGTRTAPPSHPELLDWLAVEFVEGNWSLKAIHRRIVTSAAYRQSAQVTPRQWQEDPANRLLARGPRLRVEAETIRDIALAASGLLDRRLGGPSIFPPQPAGISENRFRGAFRWEPSQGADRYRRGLYTFWKRAALYPGLALFDAPRRETSCARRLRSNTPLQALVTLNDPAFVEAAIHLGRRMLEVEPPDPGQQLTDGFRRCLSRAPTTDELELLLDYYQEELQRFQADLDAARSLVALKADEQGETPQAVAQWAALTMVANVLLNLDETITKP